MTAALLEVPPLASLPPLSMSCTVLPWYCFCGTARMLEVTSHEAEKKAGTNFAERYAQSELAR